MKNIAHYLTKETGFSTLFRGKNKGGSIKTRQLGLATGAVFSTGYSVWVTLVDTDKKGVAMTADNCWLGKVIFVDTVEVSTCHSMGADLFALDSPKVNG